MGVNAYMKVAEESLMYELFMPALFLSMFYLFLMYIMNARKTSETQRSGKSILKIDLKLFFQ